MRTAKLIVLVTLFAASPALAGRGSSPGAIQEAIASDNADTIASELERAEHLVCPSCVRMVRPLLNHADRRVRKVAAWWLVRRGLRDDLIEDMSAKLATGDAVSARNAADVLGEMKVRAALAPLGQALADGKRPVEARSAAAIALGEIGDPAARGALVTALVAAEAPVRAAAVESLRGLRGAIDPAPVVPLLTDGDEDVRVQAIYTIGAARSGAMASAAGADAVRALAAVLTSDPSARVRKKAAWALGEIGAPASLAGMAL